jgi:dihydroxyacetone kinase
VSGGACDSPGAGVDSLVALIRAIASELPRHRDELNRLDGVAGDGDLGLTVSAACAALLEVAPSLQSLPEAESIRKCGLEIARKAPSTGGTLIAFALMGAAKAEVAPGTAAVSRAAAYLDAAAATIAIRGQVALGDRTMLDALRPAADALIAAAASNASVADAVRAAASAADGGAASTLSMAAKVGRAGWLADRAAGHEDAGARLIALVFDAVSRSLNDA